MVAPKKVIAVVVLGLISSLITCEQLNLAMFNMHFDYYKQRINILRLFSMSDGQISDHKQVKRAGKPTHP